MNPVSSPVTAPSHGPDPDRTKRAVHAAHEFEAVLLNTLLGSLEHSFASIAGTKKKDPAADSYQSMGIQTLATSLADRGGIGIASMIIRGLLSTSGQVPNSTAGPTKVSLPPADMIVSHRLGR